MLTGKYSVLAEIIVDNAAEKHYFENSFGNGDLSK